MSETMSLDTIFAVSTGSGRSGIAVVRMTGPGACGALRTLVGRALHPRSLELVKLRIPATGETIDQGMAVSLPGPKTVTGEDVVEFHVHGSAAVVRKLLGVLAEIPRCRMARPGEFTRRAFANGKIDLVQAEGLADLLEAETDAQRRLAMRQLSGEASAVFLQWRDEVLTCLALIEAAIDFSDEDETIEAARADVLPRVTQLVAMLEAMVEQAGRAALVRQGFRIVIVGAPNAGKSSLLNALVGRDAAIVSPIAGTTRDVIEAGLVIEGVPVTLSDTAGLRGHTDDPIETLGMARTSREIAAADVLIWVRSHDVDDGLQLNRVPDLVVWAKSDLFQPNSIHIRNDRELMVSSKTGEGVVVLRQHLSAIVGAKTDVAEHAIAVRERHRQAIVESIRYLNEILSHPQAPLELVAELMRKTAKVLDALTGRIESEDVLGQIFSRFCIGK
jgi:tRNA modification GTPase